VLDEFARSLPRLTPFCNGKDRFGVNNQELRFQRLKFGSGNEPVPPLRLDPDEVHIWGLIMDIDDPDLTDAWSLLSDIEQERASRLLSDRHRRHHIAAHAGLRWILACYVENSPEKLTIQKTSAGKPFLGDWPSIRFNLTHSHGRALVAIDKDRDVGIDLERVRPEVDVVALAKRFLSVRDQTFIEHGDPADLHERFLKAWVAREAVFKAAGTGLTFPLKDDHIELTDDGTAGYLVLGRTQESKPVRFLPLDSEWIGAVSVEGTDWTIRYPIWNESEVSLGT